VKRKVINKKQNLSNSDTRNEMISVIQSNKKYLNDSCKIAKKDFKPSKRN